MAVACKDIVILQGNAMEVLKSLEPETIDCVVTSPPYYRHRDYGEEAVFVWDGEKTCEHSWEKNFCKKCGAWRGQLGQEPAPALYIKHLCDIFAEVRKVLKKSGCVFLNIADTCQEKSLLLVPYRLAEALTAQGWILRDIIIWAKRVFSLKEHKQFGCGRPGGFRDRLVPAYEVILFFTKSRSCFFAPLRVNGTTGVYERKSQRCSTTRGYHILGNQEIAREIARNVNGYLKAKLKESGLTPEYLALVTGTNPETIRRYFCTNLKGAALPPRDFWEKIEGLLNLDSYETVVRPEYLEVCRPFSPYAFVGNVLLCDPDFHTRMHPAPMPPELAGFLIEIGCPKGGTVLDPFGGAGTVALKAVELGRKAVLIEASSGYIKSAKQRLRAIQRKLLVMP